MASNNIKTSAPSAGKQNRAKFRPVRLGFRGELPPVGEAGIIHFRRIVMEPSTVPRATPMHTLRAVSSFFAGWATCLALWIGLTAPLAAADHVDFNRQVRPILSNSCYKCHGPDAAERQAGLRLDQQASALGKLDSGAAAIVPGRLDESELVRRATLETMATIFMGLTLGRAVCHDHKFDPVSQQEFYQLFAFYNAAADAAMDGNQVAPPPVIKVPSAETTARIAELDQQIATVRTQISTALASVQYADPGPQDNQPAGEPNDLVWIEDAVPSGGQPQGDTAWEFVSVPEHPVYSGQHSTRRQASGLSQHFFTGASDGLNVGEGDKSFASAGK
jgi:hypothetical protein